MEWIQGFLITEVAINHLVERLTLRVALSVLSQQNSVAGCRFLPGDPAPSAVRDREVLVLGVPLWGPRATGGDGGRGVRDIFCHRTAESKVFFDSVGSVHPAVQFFSYGA